MKHLSILTLVIVCATNVWADATCAYARWESYRDTLLLRHVNESAYLFTVNHVEVDADGAPNAYHPDDMKLNCTHGIGFKGLDCPANAGYPKASWWRDALVPDPTNSARAYIQPTGDFVGYFVSKTSLEDTSKVVTDTRRYVDSRHVPYIVFPGAFYNKKGTGLPGDMGYAVNLTTGDKSPFVVADIGPPNADLGEISIALAQSLGGSQPNPRTGAGTPSGKILYIVFPYSSRTHPWPLSGAEIQRYSDELLGAAGGVDAAVACKDGH